MDRQPDPPHHRRQRSPPGPRSGCPAPGTAGAPQITWIARDISTEKAVYERLHKKIFEDELTGLPHRSIFLDRLDLSLRRTADDAAPVALLFVSLDRFKEKNDRFGRDVGDLLLQAWWPHRLSASAAPPTPCRAGAATSSCSCARAKLGPARCRWRWPVAIIAAFDEPFTARGTEVFLTASVGVSTAPPGEVGTDQLLRQADAAGQMAKQHAAAAPSTSTTRRCRPAPCAGPRSRTRCAAPPTATSSSLHYQPEVSLRTNQIVGGRGARPLEPPRVGPGGARRVRARWPRPRTSSSSSGTWVLTAGMDQCARWRATFGEHLSRGRHQHLPRQFLQDDFVELVATHARAHRRRPRRRLPRDHRERPHGRHRRHRRHAAPAQGARRAARGRRLRHRLLVAVVPPPASPSTSSRSTSPS